MTKKSQFLIGAFLIAAFVGGCLFVLNSPTESPKRYQIDFLMISSSLSEIKKDVENWKKSAPNINALHAELKENQMKTVQEKSGGLVQQVRVTKDGSIFIHAKMAPKSSNTSKESEVDLLFVPNAGANGQFEWRCFGSPIAYLPKFCADLKDRGSDGAITN